MQDLRIALRMTLVLVCLLGGFALVPACAASAPSDEETGDELTGDEVTSPLSGDAFDVSLPAGKVRVYRPAGAPASCEAVLFGVGTGLTTTSYASLGDAINGHGMVFVVLDHAPGNAFGKADATKFAALVSDVKTNLLGWLGAGYSCSSVAHWVVGGHSASGQAAHAAVIANPQIAHAIFSADPYDISGLGNVKLPGLYWGFTTKTCFVDVNKAARAAYYKSPSSGRALHRTKTTSTWAACGYVPKYHHQSFIDYGVDLGSAGCNNCIPTPPSFYADVASSLNRFITARFYGTWSKANLQIPNKKTPSTLYVDGDQP